MQKVKAKGSFEDGAQAITVRPEYTECGVYGETEGEEEYTPGEFRTKTKLLTTIVLLTNECSYVFKGVTTETKTLGTDGHHAILEIECKNPGEHMETRATALKLKCNDIPAQSAANAVRYENVTNGDAKIIVTAHGFKSTTTNGVACPTGSGGTEVHENLENGGTHRRSPGRRLRRRSPRNPDRHFGLARHDIDLGRRKTSPRVARLSGLRARRSTRAQNAHMRFAGRNASWSGGPVNTPNLLDY
jgi:hypothetical protein